MDALPIKNASLTRSLSGNARIPGLLAVAVLAPLAMATAELPWLESHGLSALTVAIVLGMVIGNTLYPRMATLASPGVLYSKQVLLRAGIVLYGLRLTFQDIANVGIAGVVIDGLVLSSTFGLSWWLGTRVFKLDRKTAMLIGAGSSICGAAAVMAAEPVVRGRAEQVTVAVSTVVVFGTVAIFLYPALYALGGRIPAWGLSSTAYGIYAGSTIHEVAQVVAAGRAVAESAANTAVITKMVRVMMLAPFLVGLSAYLSRSSEADSDDAGVQNGTVVAGKPAAASRSIVIPWFALGFVAVAGLNSLALLPKPVVSIAIDVDTLLLAMAMVALGLTTQISAIRTAGIRPLALAAVLFGWLIVGGFAINVLVARWI
jgi:uncharacterized integral membrane protein (TIGR00698 family)